MAAQPLHAEEKGDCSFELRCQEQHLEVEEGLLVHREVGLAWQRRKESRLRESGHWRPRPQADTP